MTDDRAVVFSRIKEALRTPRPAPHAHAHGSAPHASSPESAVSAWLPPVEDTPAGRIAAFQERSDLLKTEFLRTTRAKLPGLIQELTVRHGWKSAAWHKTPLTEAAATASGLPLLSTDAAYNADDLEKVDVSFTGCDALVAQTGSILLGTRSAGGRSLSILAPHHVVLATEVQLLADLPAAMKLIKERYGDDLPSMLCFETGPSRTGDIERILVLGAHGPKKLTVVLLDK